MTKKRVGWVAVVFFGLGLAVALSGRLSTVMHAAHDGHGGAGERVALASLPLRDAGGEEVTLRELARGAPMVVNFWASWCAPCVAEMPLLQEAAAVHGVTTVGISYEEREVMDVFARVHGVGYPLYQSSFDIFYFMQQEGNRVAVLPYTVLLDGEGHVVADKVGEFATVAEVEEFVEVLES